MRFLPQAFASAVAVFLSTSHAGDSTPAIEDPSGFPFYGTASVGYDSSYIFRGGRFGDDAPWAGLDLNWDIHEKLSLNFGTWYVNPTNREVVSDELDVYLYAVMPVECPLTGEWEVAVGGYWYYYAEDDADEGELNLLVTKSIGNLFDFTLDYAYDVTYAAHYFGYYADKVIPLNNCLDLELGAGISHADNHYNYLVGAGDHMFVRGGLLFHLNERTDLGTYILGNFPYHDLKEAGEENGVYGGASLTVSF